MFVFGSVYIIEQALVHLLQSQVLQLEQLEQHGQVEASKQVPFAQQFHLSMQPLHELHAPQQSWPQGEQHAHGVGQRGQPPQHKQQQAA